MTEESAPTPATDAMGILPKWGHLCLFGALAVVSLIPIWMTEHFPSQNGPWYLLIVQMFKEFNNPAYDYSEYYRINWHPVPHMLHNLVVYGLSYLMPLLAAEKAALSIYVVGLPLSIFYFLSVIRPQNMILGYFGFIMIHTYSFYRGYHNFSLSLPLFLTTFSYWYSHRDRLNAKHIVVLNVLSVLLYLSHLFVFAYMSCCIGWCCLIFDRNFIKGVKKTLIATWPGWVFFVDYFILTKTQSNWIDHEDIHFLKLHESAEFFFRKFFYTISLPAYVLASLVSAWILLLVIRRGVKMVRTPGMVRQVFSTDPMVSLLIISVVAFLILPNKFVGWHKVNLRVVPIAFFFVLACADSFSNVVKASRALFLATVTVSTLLVNGFTAREIVRMEDSLQQYLSGIEHYDGNSPLLPIFIENPPFGEVRPLTRAHEYYNIAKGGANNRGVAQVNTLVSMWYLKYPVSDMLPKYKFKDPQSTLPDIKNTYSCILVYGDDPTVIENLTGAGFKLAHEAGKLKLLKNSQPVNYKPPVNAD